MNLTAYNEKQAACLLAHLLELGQTVTFAESCTGGLLAATFVANSGSSAALKQSYVTYCDEAKAAVLSVSTRTLAKYTAVSAQVAQQMAIGAKQAAGADLALSVTGVAGPGGDGVHPAGLVYIGAAYGDVLRVLCCHFVGDRQLVREQAVCRAYYLARTMLKNM